MIRSRQPQLPTTLTIVGMGTNGDGYAMVDEKKIFIPLTVPGDVVDGIYDFELGQTVYHISKFSEQRTVALCQHFGQCGGCSLQHLAPGLYKQFKITQISAPLLAHQVLYPDMTKPYMLGPHQRRRVTLKARRTSQGIELGYYQFHTHRIIDIVECPIALPLITGILQPLRTLLKTILLKLKSTAEIAITDTSAGLDILIATSTKDILDLEHREQLVDFARHYHLARLCLNDEIIVTFRNPTVDFAGFAVDIDTMAFLQASQLIDSFLRQIIDNYFQDKSFKKVADLFCGRGTLSLPLAKNCHVDGFEIDRLAIQALQKTIDQHNINRLRLYHRNLFEQPLSPSELQPYGLIVLNPPRAGAYAQIKQIADSHVPEIIYLSCNPQTFARDAAVLTACGYQFTTLIPIDQFHWSTHVELLGMFSK